jgi:hypothetical protein
MSPNRQWFTLQPRTIVRVSDSWASLGGEEFGTTAPLPKQAFLADFAVTQRGLLAFGGMLAEAFDPARHLPAVPRATSGVSASSRVQRAVA